MSIAKALADEHRVRTLLALRQGELCVCQITELLGLAPSTISKHLSILSQAGLVESRKEGRWIYYKLPCKRASAAALAAIDWVSNALENRPRAKQDAKRLKTILAQPAVELCKSQCRK